MGVRSFFTRGEGGGYFAGAHFEDIDWFWGAIFR